MFRSLILLTLSLGASLPSWAAYEEEGLSARAMAMGYPFTAVHDDLYSIGYNPASLGQLRDYQIGINYLRQSHIPAGDVDLDQISLLGAAPIRQELINGTFGFSWDYTDHEAAALDRAFKFSYGSRGFREWDDSQLNMGATMKFLTRSNPNGDSTLVPSFDFGFLYRKGARFSAGLSFLNLNGPTLLGDRAPFSFKIGVAETVRNFVWAVDFTKREPSASHRPSASVGGGLEYWVSTSRWGSFAGRTGLNLGDRLRAWSWGFGWRIFGAQWDYAMSIPMSDPTPDPSHALSMSFRFGASDPERQYEKLLREEARIRDDLTGALEAGEIKRWKFEAELEDQRRKIEVLREKLENKTAAERELRGNLDELKGRHQKAVESYRLLRKQVERTPQQKFDEEWRDYEALKARGAPVSVLTGRVRHILRQYKDTGADLSGANQELLRLLRSR